MHPNELVNVLLAARADIERHRQRLDHLLAPKQRERLDLDVDDARHLRRLFDDVLRELDEAITQRSLRS